MLFEVRGQEKILYMACMMFSAKIGWIKGQLVIFLFECYIQTRKLPIVLYC